MNRVKPLRLLPCQVHASHGTNLESGVLDALKYLAGEMALDGIRLDNGQCPFHSRRLYVTDMQRLGNGATSGGSEEATVLMTVKQRDDQDVHKGAIEGDRPGDEQIGNPHGEAIDAEGWPNDEIAVAEDAVGALEDETQG